MTGSLNKASLIGFLGSDPERRSMTGGGDVVSFSIATSERWTTRDGQRQERTDWHRIVIFNEHVGKIAMQYLRKGSSCYVEGQIQHRKYRDNSGAERTVTEIVMQKFDGKLLLLDRGQADQAERPPSGREAAAGDRADPPAQPSTAPLLDDDVPF